MWTQELCSRFYVPTLPRRKMQGRTTLLKNLYVATPTITQWCPVACPCWGIQYKKPSFLITPSSKAKTLVILQPNLKQAIQHQSAIQITAARRSLTELYLPKSPVVPNLFWMGRYARTVAEIKKKKKKKKQHPFVAALVSSSKWYLRYRRWPEESRRRLLEDAIILKTPNRPLAGYAFAPVS